MVLFGVYVPVPPLHTYAPLVAEPDNVKSFVEQIVPPTPASATGTCAGLLFMVITIASITTTPVHVARVPVTFKFNVTEPASISAALGV